MNRYGKRCVLYPRVSTEMQVDGYSLEGQKNMLTRFADREEMIVVNTYEDAGKSGKFIEGLDESVQNRLIGKILIGEVKKADGRRVQEVRIVYNFVGEIPEIAA